jgi:hypothetical protein
VLDSDLLVMEVKNMKRIGVTLCHLIFTAIAMGGSAAAQTLVVGTGHPEVDVPAVQAAVDQGGEVVLNGHFSFDRSPTVPTGYGGFATVRVSKAVVISGADDEDGGMAIIEGGTTPFYVEVPGFPVTIQRLRFIRPTVDAINVYAVSGLVIASCRIEGVEPGKGGFGEGIDISTTPGINVPNLTSPGKPENVSGTLLIANNDIDVGGTALDDTVGVVVFSVGIPGAEVEAYVSGNHISNTTEPAIAFRHVVGRVHIEHNVLTTGSVSGRATNLQVIRVANTGSYVIAHNSIDCGWAQAQGIGVFSQLAGWPMEGAVVEDNDVNMSPPENTAFGQDSAGISIRGFAQGNVVLNNRIRGSARAAVAIDDYRGGTPDKNTLIRNRFDDFEASRADVFVDVGVTNTVILGQKGTLEDNGVNTVSRANHDRGSRSDGADSID